MRDLVFVAFLMAFVAAGFRRPFFFVLAYVYIDTVQPQRLTYTLLNTVPISLLAFVLAVGGWVLADKKTDSRFGPRQAMLAVLLLYCGLTTMSADFPLEALDKWGWVWKSLLFAIFLPLTLTTRLRFESLSLVMCLSAASIIIVGGIKTLASGGGYGGLNLMVTNNSGIYESSIISTVAIAIIPFILYMLRNGTIFPPDWRVKIFGAALIFSCLLIPVGTEARTGVVCIAVLAILLLRQTRRRFLWIGLAGVAAMVAVPFLPQSFTKRMDTITEYQADTSASTRVAVWKWTMEYARDNPMGGGFMAYLQNRVRYEAVKTEGAANHAENKATVVEDAARAYHSSYFEMLGEQGYPGLILWLSIHAIGLLRMEILYHKYRKRSAEDGQWVGQFALALQQAHIIVLIGSLFVGIAFQPFVWIMVTMQIGLDSWQARRFGASGFQPMVLPRGSMTPAN